MAYKPGMRVHILIFLDVISMVSQRVTRLGPYRRIGAVRSDVGKSYFNAAYKKIVHLQFSMSAYALMSV